MTGPTAASDLERAMGELGQLLGAVQGYAGQGVMGVADGFGMKGLAQRAARVLGDADLHTLVDDLFEDLARMAKAKRGGYHPGPIDIGKAVRETETVDLPFLRGEAQSEARAREAARDEWNKQRSKRGLDRSGSPPPPGQGGAKGRKLDEQGRKQQEEQQRLQERRQGSPPRTMGRDGRLRLAPGTVVPPPPAGGASASAAMKTALASVTDGSISKLIVGGAAEPLSHAVGCFDAAQQAAIGSARGQQACPFAFLVPPCKKAGDGRCEKCASGVKPPAGLIDLVLAKCDAERATLIRDKRKAARLD